MLYFNLSLAALPQIKAACSASTAKYKLHIENSENLEITTIEGCGVEMTVNGKTYKVPPKSVFVIMPGMSVDVVSNGDGVVYDDTIAVTVDSLKFETMHTAAAKKADAEGEDTVLLPMVLTPGDDYANITRLIRTFVSYYVRNSAFARCRCLSVNIRHGHPASMEAHWRSMWNLQQSSLLRVVGYLALWILTP